MVGHQCAQEGLALLSENQDSWLDVYTFLYHSFRQTTTCLNCGHESHSETETLFSKLCPCPPHKSDLKPYMEQEFNNFETVEYRCEDGCQARGQAVKRQRLMSDSSSNHLIVVIDRSMENIRDEVEATKDIVLLNTQEVECVYTPISVIKYQGM